MKLHYLASPINRVKADAVAVLLSEDSKLFDAGLKELRKTFGKRLDNVLKLENFGGKEGEVCHIHSEKKLAAPLLFLTGAGERDKLSLESLRRASAAVAKKAQSMKLKHLAVVLPAWVGDAGSFTATAAEAATALGEGAYLALYRFDKYLTEKKNAASKITDVTLVGAPSANEREVRTAVRMSAIVCEAVCFARDLENAPSNEIYPETLAAAAVRSADRYGYSATVWDKKKIEQAGFGGLLAVNAGSVRPPRFITLEHNQGLKDLETVVLIGKGITFDTGGISIKPSNNMAEMKMDMSGAAAVIGTLEAAARLKLSVHLVGLIPTTENMPSGSAMNPGDIITHYGGKTSEVDNTDAEGRLILADVLAYAGKFQPDAVVDLATLTGACVVALGAHASGMFGNDDGLMKELKSAGERTYERVWPLPLYAEYEKQIKSDVADVKNVGGRWGGAITAAWFLKKFIPSGKGYKWVHLDIAGTAILEEDFPYAPKGGSGVGVRLLVDFLKNRKG